MDDTQKIRDIWIKYFDLPNCDEDIYQRDVYAENCLDFVAELVEKFGLYKKDQIRK